MPTLSAINIYPVKSMAGISLTEAEVQPRGLKGDRRWMVVDTEGRFITQREHPKLAVVNAQVEGDTLRLDAPGIETVWMKPRLEKGRMEVDVWGDRVQAAPADRVGDHWISTYLGMPCRLVYMAPDSVRPVDPSYARDGEEVSFADGYPVLLASEASLQDLNDRLPSPVPMSRFRPNLVLSGTEAFEEDTWQEVRIGEVRFHVVKPCDRCTVTTIDQATGQKTGKEPLRTLSTYRKMDGKTLFAQNLIPAETGTVQVGDAVKVLKVSR